VGRGAGCRWLRRLRRGFAPEVAARLQRHIYAAGSRVAPQETYVAFRGRPAAVQPLLKKRGLLDEVPA